MNAPFIPAATAAKIANPAPNGERHKQANDIAFSLIGNGFAPSAVFQQLREMYPPDVTDEELTKVVQWSADKSPPPSGYGTSAPTRKFTPLKSPPKAIAVVHSTPQEHAAWWLGGSELSSEKFTESSPIKIPENNIEAAKLMFELIYAPEECVNIVCQFIKKEDKANPNGSGKTQTRNQWVEWFSKKGLPESEAGAWMRPNPCLPIGTGSGGAITDDDTEHHRFILLESDCLPIEQQFALYSKLKIPIAVVLSSGGKSIHAWARIDAANADQYRTFTKRILTALAPLGIDQANKNSSRLSRLAGARRVIGAAGDGVQKLLWLNPKVLPFTESNIVELEQSLEYPLISEKPLKALVKNALARYEELLTNRGKLGVPTGIEDFDKMSGGLKDGNFIVIAAETGGGKSTLAINFINNALKAGIGVALFTLEMDRDEIMDALVSLNCGVDRNHFNTGDFFDPELVRISSRLSWLSNLPLWIFDSSLVTAEDVRRSTLELKGEKKIGLVVVDYVQLLNSNEYPNSREQQIASISRSLRSLAKEAKLPLIGLSQLNDEGKLRESRVLAHEAHIVFLLENLEGEAKLRIIKGRRIARGVFDLQFNSKHGEIKSQSKIHWHDVPQPYNDI